jgi:hypothetical protein
MRPASRQRIRSASPERQSQYRAPASVTKQLYSWNIKRQLSTSPLPADCYRPSVVSRPTQAFSARVSRLALQSVRSHDWTSQGQNGHSVGVYHVSLFILSRTTADLSRSTRTFSACARYSIDRDNRTLYSVQDSDRPLKVDANVSVCVRDPIQPC